MPIPQPSPIELRDTQALFGFLSPAPIEKDWYVVQAMRTLLAVDPTPFRLVFAGGTCLARAHGLVERMSEDVDFKVVAAEAPKSKNQLRQALGRLRDTLVAELTEAGFELAQPVRSRDDNRYTVLHLRAGEGRAGEIGTLRATIQIELRFAALRESSLMRPVASFITQAYKRAPDLKLVECVSVTETAAEKAVSLTRRTAMELAGVNRDTDPTLVRHIYDLHALRDKVDREHVGALMREIAVMDAEQFGHQHPVYRADIAGESKKALDFLSTDPGVRELYASFMAAMVYGQATPFDEAIDTVCALVNNAWP
jgi:predicted nucleotidyltransferase component of viral defense system